jgi:hypothetical protein
MKSFKVLLLLPLLLVTALASLKCVRANETSEKRQLSAARANQYETSRLPALEQQVLAAARGRAERQGNQLTLVLLDGRRIEFQSCPSTPFGPPRNCLAEFYLVADLPSRHAYIVCAAHGDRCDVGVIDDRSGRASVLPSIPYFSPDGTELVAVDNGDVFPDPAIQIWRAESDGWTIEWGRNVADDPVKHETFLTRWTDRNHIVLEFRSAKHKWPALLKRDQSGWQLTTKWPKD